MVPALDEGEQTNKKLRRTASNKMHRCNLRPWSLLGPVRREYSIFRQMIDRASQAANQAGLAADIPAVLMLEAPLFWGMTPRSRCVLGWVNCIFFLMRSLSARVLQRHSRIFTNQRSGAPRCDPAPPLVRAREGQTKPGARACLSAPRCSVWR